MAFNWIPLNIGRVMPLTCPLIILFVLKLENHLSQELEISYRAWAQKFSEYLLFFPGWNPPPPQKKKIRFGFFVKIHLLESSKLECRVCTSKVIHIFCNVDCTTCFTLCRWLLLCIFPLLTVWHIILVSVPPTSPLPTPTPCFFFSDLDCFSKFTY